MEYSKATVFSIAPYESKEFKPGLYPGQFNIVPCFDENIPVRLVVGVSHHLMAVGGKKEPLRVITYSEEIANSIVNDFLDGQLFSTPNAHPGICWVPGEVSVDNFKVLYVEKHIEMKAMQRRWFILIVQKTEDDWKKYKNSRVVSDPARFAVRALGISTPEWMRTEELGLADNKCPACGVANEIQNVVCSGCRALLTPELFAAKTREDKLKVLSFAN